jgi:geranylgeranyl pyrophosphate synthase
LAATVDEIVDRVKIFAGEFTADLEKLLASTDIAAPHELREAVRYALLGAGKRLRPFLVRRCCVLVGGTSAEAFAPAVAVEMVHAFSLVHDDLPAMDDDDLRRGRPTCHKQFGEATAILAGDALLALAFETLATHIEDPGRAVSMSAELARATGWSGMIGGQAADLAGERQPSSLECVQRIHERKTGALFAAACRLGAIAGGAEAGTIERLGTYGRRLGLAFQIADDLLDVTGTSEQLGKQVAKDAARRKQTYPACVGTGRTMAAGESAAAEAIASLSGFSSGADDLRALAEYAVRRRS